MTHINNVLVHFRADASECTRKGGTGFRCTNSPLSVLSSRLPSRRVQPYMASSKILRVVGRGRHKEQFPDICSCFPAVILRGRVSHWGMSDVDANSSASVGSSVSSINAFDIWEGICNGQKGENGDEDGRLSSMPLPSLPSMPNFPIIIESKQFQSKTCFLILDSKP